MNPDPQRISQYNCVEDVAMNPRIFEQKLPRILNKPSSVSVRIDHRKQVLRIDLLCLSDTSGRSQTPHKNVDSIHFHSKIRGVNR